MTPEASCPDGRSVFLVEQEVQFSAFEMQVGTADAAVGHFDFNVVRPGDLGLGNVEHLQGSVSEITNTAHNALLFSTIDVVDGFSKSYYNINKK